MRVLALALLTCALLAGCASPSLAAPREAATAPPATAAHPPAHLAGTVWLAPSQGQERVRVELPFDAATGMAIDAKLAFGMRMGVDLPAGFGDVVVELRGPDDALLATGHLTAQEATAALHASANATGTHRLVLLSYGGSDGAANGDHVDYALDAR